MSTSNRSPGELGCIAISSRKENTSASVVCYAAAAHPNATSLDSILFWSTLGSPCFDNGTCAYGTPNAEQFGTASVGTERAPGFRQIDLTAGKAFHITEAQALEFRADFFNAFNFASYGNPDNNPGDTNFGQITSTRNLPRQIQFSLHYAF